MKKKLSYPNESMTEDGVKWQKSQPNMVNRLVSGARPVLTWTHPRHRADSHLTDAWRAEWRHLHLERWRLTHLDTLEMSNLIHEPFPVQRKNVKYLPRGSLGSWLIARWSQTRKTIAGTRLLSCVHATEQCRAVGNAEKSDVLEIYETDDRKDALTTNFIYIQWVQLGVLDNRGQV